MQLKNIEVYRNERAVFFRAFNAMAWIEVTPQSCGWEIVRRPGEVVIYAGRLTVATALVRRRPSVAL